MNFDTEKKKLDISVREIAQAMKSSNGEGYISRRLRARIGHDAHKTYQDRTEGETEYYVKFNLDVDDWDVLVRGRVDVVHKNGNAIHLEEIKSTTLSVDEVEQDEAHILQLQLYCFYFYKFEGFGDITAELIIIDPVNNKRRKIEVEPKPIAEFLEEHLRNLIHDHQKELRRKEILKKRAPSIKFPYPSYRPFQEEIIAKLEESFPKQERVMLHAPPGIGKTVTTLYPALKYGIANAKRVFVVTSKTTQQMVYTEAIRDFLNKGAQFKSIKITAKGKVCHTEKYDCYDLDCPYLERYYSKDNDRTISELLELDLIQRDNIEFQSNMRQICPFELTLDTALFCDLIVSDFNYIFHPRIRFQRFSQEFEESILIVDEAHNLLDRAADFYSESLSVSQVRDVISFVKQSHASSQVKYRLKIQLKRLMKYIQRLKDQIASLEQEHSLVKIDRDMFDKLQVELDKLSIEYINSLPFEPKKKDPLIKFTDHFKFFTLLLRETDEPEFEEIYDIHKRQVRILCKSAAKKLLTQMDEFDSVIVQSATLEPLEYYRNMLGLPESTNIMKYPNPFPKENRLYLVEPKISTTYRERNLFIDQLAEVIQQVTLQKQGNYLVFFSSFEYLKKVRQVLRLDSNQKLLTQQPSMSENARKRLIRQLKTNNNIVVLAVLGGIFSEGVDYTGDLAVGSIIVGPGLPKISFDQELKKQYFDTIYGQGFDYAYKFPGISKVIQAAGRVFRTETDRGFVLFVGHRYQTDQYLPLLTEDFDIEIDNVLSKIQDHWKNK